MRASSLLLIVMLSGGLFFFPQVSEAQEYPSISTPSQVEQGGNHDTAVIVAVEDYLFLPEVKGAIANGNDWELFFQRSLGVETVHFLSNTQATKEGMERFARLAAESAHPEGTLWFIFIGHGAPGPGGTDGLLVGADTQQDTDSMVARGLPQQELLDILHEGQQAQTVLVVDACFSGRDGGGEALVEAMPVVAMNTLPTLQRPTAVFSAAQATEFAGPLPGEDRPAFSYLLLGALRGWAADDGEVSASDAHQFTQRALRGIPGRFQQTPSLFGASDLVLVRGAREADPGISRIINGRSRPGRADGACDQGMVRNSDTDNNCCWAGQVWSNSRDRCIGIPTSCPGALMADAASQACVAGNCRDGQIRLPDSQACCWQGQEYSESRQTCVGVPTICPANFQVHEETCLADSRMAQMNGSSGSSVSSNFEDVSFRTGFLPDPRTITGTSGGRVDAATLGSCVGQISGTPDHLVDLETSFNFLRFRVYSDSDTSLVIQGPNGQVYCNDDDVGLDPAVEGSFSPGQYRVFIGDVGGNHSASYRMEITERRGQPNDPVDSDTGSYGDASLSPGFQPDPYTMSGTAGGDNDASGISGNHNGSCVGNIANSPDHVVTLNAPFSYLRFDITSDEDTTLVIRGPNNHVYCNDDTVGLNPQVSGAFPQGQYQVFVGTYDGGYPSYRMQITEYREDHQNNTGSGTYGDASLTSGFQPDPHRMSGTAGGTVDASAFGGTGCVGTIANHPDHVVTLNSSFNYLRFLVTSSQDTTMVIRGPNGQFYCDDDSVGLNPQIGRDFSSGRYEIYIGVGDDGYPSYDLEITEYRP